MRLTPTAHMGKVLILNGSPSVKDGVAEATIDATAVAAVAVGGRLVGSPENMVCDSERLTAMSPRADMRKIGAIVGVCTNDRRYSVFQIDFLHRIAILYGTRWHAKDGDVETDVCPPSSVCAELPRRSRILRWMAVYARSLPIQSPVSSELEKFGRKIPRMNLGRFARFAIVYFRKWGEVCLAIRRVYIMLTPLTLVHMTAHNWRYLPNTFTMKSYSRMVRYAAPECAARYVVRHGGA